MRPRVYVPAGADLFIYVSRLFIFQMPFNDAQGKLERLQIPSG